MNQKSAFGGWAFWPALALLAPQALWARRRALRMSPAEGPDHGIVGPSNSNAGLLLVALGDSIIAGVGVPETAQAIPAQLAEALARRVGQGVAWQARGESGARTDQLLRKLRDDPPPAADLYVLSLGLNDVTGLRGADAWRRDARLLAALLLDRDPDARVCWLGLPPLQHFPALPRPLRQVLATRMARFETAARTMFDDEPRAVYMPFDRAPEPHEFAEDGYHPGPDAIAHWAGVVAQRLAVQDGIGIKTGADQAGAPLTGESRSRDL